MARQGARVVTPPEPSGPLTLSPLPLSLGVLLAFAAPAWADTPSTPESELGAAREAYVLGDFTRARAAFLAVVQRARNVGDVPAEVESAAWIYLGEMQLFAGDRRAAEASFRMALQRDPTLRLSPVEHPENVIGVVEVVRQAALSEDQEPADRKPMPYWGYAPLGVPQFVQRRPVRGAVYATLQVGAAASSVAAWIVIDQRRAAIPDNLNPTLFPAAEAELRYLETLRDAWSIPSAAAFYLVWAISVGDSGIAWRNAQAAPSSFGLIPRPDGVEVAASWRF